ncbi:hypothetical protein [Paractinoplanes maris]|uniref:hypothetical protein n=1 Tax=Paractinoplanes maris TaxID=1734446 RepID=UPI0020219951|nr:hypothetical protein [Actinoplanes maris]
MPGRPTLALRMPPRDDCCDPVTTPPARPAWTSPVGPWVTVDGEPGSVAAADRVAG